MTTRNRPMQSVWNFDPDVDDRLAFALRAETDQNNAESRVHRHRKGQLLLALRGGVTCEVPNAMWMVPPHHAVWIPSNMPHRNRVTSNAQICFLFIEPKAALMPDDCCTLAITPLVRELILHLADQVPVGSRDESTARIIVVLLEQLTGLPVEQLYLPVSNHPKIRFIADALATDPADRATLASWAGQLAMGDRSLARLIKRETGLTFGRWRQQLHLIVALRQLSTGATVQQVAGDLGYDSVTAFITMFKKSLGQSPAAYFATLR
jgi:AraC-like DNA-binding protein